MYGFHKGMVAISCKLITADKSSVSDVFHTGNPESSLWEFKHGNGSFKRGNLTGLREIKRRASRHALVHRDSYPSSKQSMSQPGTPAEPMQPMPDAMDARMANFEHTLYDMHNRLAKSEETTQFLHVRHQAVMEALSRSLQINQEMARAVLSIVPNPDAPIHRDSKLPAFCRLASKLTIASCDYAERNSASDGYFTLNGRAIRSSSVERKILLFQH